MQLRKDQFYSRLNEKYGVSEELAESICEFILRRWQEWTKHPDNLNLDIKFFGVMRLRYRKGRRIYKNLVKQGVDLTCKECNDFKKKWEYDRWERESKYVERITHLLFTVYPAYLEERDHYRALRKEMEVLREVNDDPLFIKLRGGRKKLDTE